jgi:adenosylhomocysteine nucleosidase
MPERIPARFPAAVPRPFKVALLAALPMEVRPFLRRRKLRPLKGLGVRAREFVLKEGRGVVVLTGMGWGMAHQAAVRLLARCRPQMVLSLGFGGALTPQLSPGAIVLGTTSWHFYPDRGWLKEVPAPSPPRPLPEMLQHLADRGLSASAANFVTTPYIIHKGRQGAPLLSLTNPVVDLENSAVAEVAAAHGLPFVGLRVIVDAAGEEIPAFVAEAWEPGGKLGARHALTWLAADPRRAKDLLHWRRRSRAAAQQLAQALEVLLPLR